MSMIVTRPQHDVTTRYLSSWAGEIIDFAKSKGMVVIDLIREKATKKELEGRIKKAMPSVVFLNGHGSAGAVTGHNNNDLVNAGDNHQILAGKITYALSCHSARTLGPKVVESRGSAYIGYVDEFSFVADRRYLTRPAEDPSVKPFKESSNQVMISLLKGHNAEIAVGRSRAVFKNNYQKSMASTADPDALQIAQLLWWNMRNIVCLGDGNMKCV